MATLIPFLFSEDSRAQAEFYVGALGGEIQSVMTHGQAPEPNDAIKDKVMHLCLLAGGINFFMADSIGPLTQGNGISLNLNFEPGVEGREAFDNLAAGGTVIHPLEPVFWGGMYGQVEDKYGVNWMISC
ncbi:VOC family protein [Paenibacillus sp. WQ 127069]|uniref:VOC family protein n=1 Tax=Paenibacillus baimaensis TaxID=2982185 RepID=A0ABT2UIP8_9BACL|nr:VOC family protein [Paenibacillus sp. WQ 127069]MCU6794497.1 VOC family protein [Paenibacillus sp. WQ 127069]